MKPRIYIVDDDNSIRRILSNIIEDYDLGVVIGQSGDGKEAQDEISKIYPDIVLIDLLLPSIDGIEVINNIKKSSADIQFIMISEVTSNQMITDAYKAGIEFYLNKPLNVVEVVSITRNAIEAQKLKRVVSQLSRNLGTPERTAEQVNIDANENVLKEVMKTLSELGISGESGYKDLINIVRLVLEEREKPGVNMHKYNMNTLYERLYESYKADNMNSASSFKAIEQRIRRAALSGLNNIASIGVEDFDSYKFDRYAYTLFEFQDVKKEMDYIRGKSKVRGRVSIKNFIEGIITLST